MAAQYVDTINGGGDVPSTIQEATSAPGVYHFGELLDLQQVQQVKPLDLRLSCTAAAAPLPPLPFAPLSYCTFSVEM